VPLQHNLILKEGLRGTESGDLVLTSMGGKIAETLSNAHVIASKHAAE